MLFIFLVWHKIASSVHRFSIEIETISRNEFCLPEIISCFSIIFVVIFSSGSLLVHFSLFSLSLSVSPSFTFLHFTLSLICLLLLSLLLFMCKLKWQSFWEHILLLIPHSTHHRAYETSNKTIKEKVLFVFIVCRLYALYFARKKIFRYQSQQWLFQIVLCLSLSRSFFAIVLIF